ncbi:hypothetical protein NQ317_015821 [Molorchus minor]|uniref:Uncharacterized protein n=1 Tax=Molorchus minor TaxID=1323400 RepID=A0ABQ9JN88_9CUCU|nr:hypothetical protein NQ317_015821 [Molorchus minor]
MKWEISCAEQPNALESLQTFLSQSSYQTPTAMSEREHRVSRWYFGGLAAASATCFTHPLDLIKVLLQTQHGPEKPSISKITSDIIKKNGIIGLYSGISAALCRQLTYSTTRFAIYEVAKQHLKMDTFQMKVAVAGIAGFIGVSWEPQPI